MDTESAVSASHDTVPAYQVRVTPDSLRNQLRVLNVIGLHLDYARYQHLAFGQTDVLKQRPFMRMAWIRGFKLNRMRLGFPDQVDDVFQRHVAVVRSRIVTPAQVHPDFLRRDVDERMVQHRNMQ